MAIAPIGSAGSNTLPTVPLAQAQQALEQTAQRVQEIKESAKDEPKEEGANDNRDFAFTGSDDPKPRVEAEARGIDLDIRV